jgi:hypothetical protein
VEALGRLREVFQGAGLEAPPIPARFRESLREFDNWLFGTRQLDRMGMYFVRPYLEEVVGKRLDDYVAVSHAGHGVNSYSINYHLLYGPIGVFAQTAWGGGYMDNEKQAGALRDQFGRCHALIRSADLVAESGRLSESGRLVVVESDFREELSRWGWLERPLTEAKEVQGWLEDGTTKQASALAAALGWLEAGLPEE